MAGYSTLITSSYLHSHDAQLILINNIGLLIQSNKIQIMRKINKRSMLEFIFHLSLESWEDIFEDKDVNT
jgi:hypothetical protein